MNTLEMAEYAATLPAAFAANFGHPIKLIGFRPMSLHQGDAHLFVVISRHEDDTFTRWTYNARSGGFSGYDLDVWAALIQLGVTSS